MKEAHKRNRNPKYKRKYRVANWPEYDRSLRNRGDITIWFSEDAIQAWSPMHNGKLSGRYSRVWRGACGGRGRTGNGHFRGWLQLEFAGF